MIEIKGLHKSFGRVSVLQGVDLRVDVPQTTAILGPNGSGKTTLVKCFLGMVAPDRGQVFMDGRDVRRHISYRKNISYLPQIARFPENLRCRELIRMIKDLRPGATREHFFIDLFDLQNEMTKKTSQLSGGTRQKLNLVLSLMYDSALIILDEPTTGLDPLALIRLKRHLREERQRGKQILITTHIMSFVEEVADRIVFLLNGKVYFDGSLPELIRSQTGTSLEEAIANILSTHSN